jgi:spore coat assembly protein
MNIGDLVTRVSYNNDIVFKIINIKDDIAYLKGNDVRLVADAPLSDLIKSEILDEFNPNMEDLIKDRDEYFYLPGKILHLDGDADYLSKSMDFYKKTGVFAVGMQINESDMPSKINKLLNDIKPDILVITGHDAYYEKLGDKYNSNNYKNSNYFIETVRNARIYESSHEKLVIVAGACQSDYEDLIRSGANFASSPKRVNIHALDPAIIATNISLTDKNMSIDIKSLLNKTKYGKNGIGGIVGNGMMYVGYPR